MGGWKKKKKKKKKKHMINIKLKEFFLNVCYKELYFIT